MTDKERTTRRNAAPVIVVAVLLFAVLPLVYIASTGPLIGLQARGYISPRMEDALEVVYTPIGLVTQHCPPANTALLWYVSFWMPEDGKVMAQ